MNHVMRNLRALGEDQNEAMFVLSQLNFGDFLNQPAYAATVQRLGLRMPADLDTPTVKYSDGEADILLFHRRLGILIGEVKAVGWWHATHNNTTAPDSDVAKRVQKAVKQLSNSKRIISHVISDVAPGLAVQTTLFLPYVSSSQLLRVLTANSASGQVSTVGRCHFQPVS
jgi:hypothetical protein